jgi:hypothetical protein
MNSKILILIICVSTLIVSCKSKTEDDSKEIKADTLKYAIVKKFYEKDYEGAIEKTFYEDGRETEVRVLSYYNSLIKNYQPISDDTNNNNKLKVTTIIAEWNKVEAVVAGREALFIQLPNNSMLGGDVETNRRNIESSRKYFDKAYSIFEKEYPKFKMASNISNRDTSSVTFDFFTDKGFYTIQESKSKLESGESVWSELFVETRKIRFELEKTMKTNEWKGQ